MRASQRPDGAASAIGEIIVESGCVVTPHGLLEPCNILVRGDCIAAVGPPDEVRASPGARRIAAAGQVVLPGLINVRVPIPTRSPAAGCGPAELARWGVARFVPCLTLSCGSALDGVLQGLEGIRRAPIGARPIGLRAEVPLRVGPNGGIDGSEAKRLLLEAQKIRLGGSLLVIVPAAAEEAAELARWAATEGMVVGMDPANADYERGRRLIEAGVRHVTDTVGALGDLHHRQPGAVAAALLDDDVTAELSVSADSAQAAAAGLVLRAKGFERCILAPDAEGHPGEATLQALAAAAGLPEVGLPRASRMASEGPAALSGAGESLGRIAEGMIADLTLLTRGLEVVATIVEGSLAWQRDAA